MITVTNLSYEFPQKELYNNISFSINKGEHCAFIGTSGTGKSTLADMLTHPDKYLYDGTIELPVPFRTGYVSQFPPKHEENISVFDYIAAEFINLQGRIDNICLRMEGANDFETIMEEYQLAYDSFEAIDGTNYENNIKKNLNLASIGHLKDSPIHILSGGEFKLVQIIKEMLIKPDLLIMDEPDVFLDFDHLSALMLLINSHKESLLVITHNRFLLNHCFNKILHLEDKCLREFEGNYIDYNYSLLEQKIQMQELASADNAEIARNQAIVNQLRLEATTLFSAAKGKTLNARVKIVERLEARKQKDPFVEIKKPDLSFSTSLLALPTINEVANFSAEEQIAYEALAQTPMTLEHIPALNVSNYSLAFDTTLFRKYFFYDRTR